MSNFEQIKRSYCLGREKAYDVSTDKMELVLAVPDRLCTLPGGNPFWHDVAYRPADGKFFFVFELTDWSRVRHIKLVEAPKPIALSYMSTLLCELMRTLDSYVAKIGQQINFYRQNYTTDECSALENDCLDAISRAKHEIEQIKKMIFRFAQV